METTADLGNTRFQDFSFPSPSYLLALVWQDLYICDNPFHELIGLLQLINFFSKQVKWFSVNERDITSTSGPKEINMCEQPPRIKEHLISLRYLRSKKRPTICNVFLIPNKLKNPPIKKIHTCNHENIVRLQLLCKTNISSCPTWGGARPINLSHMDSKTPLKVSSSW